MAKARAEKREDGKVWGYSVECPGCGHPHVFNVDIPGEANKAGRPRWSFNGDVDRPTFSPSMLTWNGNGPSGEKLNKCHLFVTDGVIDFLGDTTAHALRGKHPLADLESDIQP